MFAVDKDRAFVFNWFSISCYKLYKLYNKASGDVWFLRCFHTFFAGSMCIILQSKQLQIEGVTVVSERDPSPLSQRLGAHASVDPLMNHRLIWQKQNI